MNPYLYFWKIQVTDRRSNLVIDQSESGLNDCYIYELYEELLLIVLEEKRYHTYLGTEYKIDVYLWRENRRRINLMKGASFHSFIKKYTQPALLEALLISTSDLIKLQLMRAQFIFGRLPRHQWPMLHQSQEYTE